MPIADDVVEALKRSVAPPLTENPFKTYGEFARRHGLSETFPLAWANRGTLDRVAAALKSDPAIRLDLTFLIRNTGTGYPSVIDSKAYDESPAHKQRARDEADRIIAKFSLPFANPY
jgi:hypothetical protein